MGHQRWLLLVTVSIIILTGQVGWTWGSCAHEDLKTHYTTQGEQCAKACDKAGYDYYWCKTRNSWDYCSPAQNTDYKGINCKKDHPCGRHGKSYYWCKTEKGEESKCGPVESKTMKYKSSKYQSVCIGDCLYDESKKYFWCYTEKGWDRCSPTVDVTYKNEPCRWDHSCGTYGYSYSWCWTKSSWDYCGLIEPCECTYYSTRRRKRDTNNAVLFCNQIDKGRKLVTTFYAEPFLEPEIDDSYLRNEIISLIAKWDSKYLSDQSKSNLIDSKYCTINQQKVSNAGKESHNHLKIIVHSRNQHELIATVCHIVIPVKKPIPDRYIRMAFLESFRKRAKITVETNVCKDEEQKN